MSDWQPIETAPRGFKLIVGYRNDLGRWRSTMATYYVAGSLSLGEDMDDEFAPEGWYEESETQDHILELWVPTHWASLLPEPQK